MSDLSDWDADDYEPPAVETAAKESWEDEEEDDIPDPQEEKLESAVKPQVPKKYADMDRDELIEVIMKLEREQNKGDSGKKSKLTKKAIREKEEQERREAELRAAAVPELTPEERAAQKIIEKRVMEQAEIDLASELVSDGPREVVLIEAMQPNTKAEFGIFREAIAKKVSKYSVSPHYVDFLEELLRDLLEEQTSDDINKISKSINVIKNEKVKAEKGNKKKGSKKPQLGGGGTKVAMHELEGYGALEEDDDDVDFM